MNQKRIFLLSAILAGFSLTRIDSALAQSVIFPQKEQPGLADVQSDGTVYTLGFTK